LSIEPTPAMLEMDVRPTYPTSLSVILKAILIIAVIVWLLLT
jgi:hypothetical protein